MEKFRFPFQGLIFQQFVAGAYLPEIQKGLTLTFNEDPHIWSAHILCLAEGPDLRDPLQMSVP